MMLKAKKFMYRVLKGHLPGIAYEKLVINLIPEFIGFLSLWFYKLLYRDVKIGKGVKCWGSV